MIQDSYLNILINDIKRDNPKFIEEYDNFYHKQKGGSNVLKEISNKFLNSNQEGGDYVFLHTLKNQKICILDSVKKYKIKLVFPIFTEPLSSIIKYETSYEYDIELKIDNMENFLNIENKKVLFHYYNELVITDLENNTDTYNIGNKKYILSSSIPFRTSNLKYGKLNKNIYNLIKINFNKNIKLEILDNRKQCDIISKEIFMFSKKIENNTYIDFSVYTDIFSSIINFIMLSIYSCHNNLFIPDFDYLHNKLDIYILVYIYFLAIKTIYSLDYNNYYPEFTRDNIGQVDSKILEFIGRLKNKTIKINITLLTNCPNLKILFNQMNDLFEDNSNINTLHENILKIAELNGDDSLYIGMYIESIFEIKKILLGSGLHEIGIISKEMLLNYLHVYLISAILSNNKIIINLCREEIFKLLKQNDQDQIYMYDLYYMLSGTIKSSIENDNLIICDIATLDENLKFFVYIIFFNTMSTYILEYLLSLLIEFLEEITNSRIQYDLFINIYNTYYDLRKMIIEHVIDLSNVEVKDINVINMNYIYTLVELYKILINELIIFKKLPPITRFKYKNLNIIEIKETTKSLGTRIPENDPDLNVFKDKLTYMEGGAKISSQDIINQCEIYIDICKKTYLFKKYYKYFETLLYSFDDIINNENIVLYDLLLPKLIIIHILISNPFINDLLYNVPVERGLEVESSSGYGPGGAGDSGFPPSSLPKKPSNGSYGDGSSSESSDGDEPRGDGRSKLPRKPSEGRGSSGSYGEGSGGTGDHRPGGDGYHTLPRKPYDGKSSKSSKSHDSSKSYGEGSSEEESDGESSGGDGHRESRLRPGEGRGSASHGSSRTYGEGSSGDRPGGDGSGRTYGEGSSGVKPGGDGHGESQRRREGKGSSGEGSGRPNRTEYDGRYGKGDDGGSEDGGRSESSSASRRSYTVQGQDGRPIELMHSGRGTPLVEEQPSIGGPNIARHQSTRGRVDDRIAGQHTPDEDEDEHVVNTVPAPVMDASGLINVPLRMVPPSEVPIRQDPPLSRGWQFMKALTNTVSRRKAVKALDEQEVGQVASVRQPIGDRGQHVPDPELPDLRRPARRYQGLGDKGVPITGVPYLGQDSLRMSELESRAEEYRKQEQREQGRREQEHREQGRREQEQDDAWQPRSRSRESSLSDQEQEKSRQSNRGSRSYSREPHQSEQEQPPSSMRGQRSFSREPHQSDQGQDLALLRRQLSAMPVIIPPGGANRHVSFTQEAKSAPWNIHGLGMGLNTGRILQRVNHGMLSTIGQSMRPRPTSAGNRGIGLMLIPDIAGDSGRGVMLTRDSSRDRGRSTRSDQEMRLLVSDLTPGVERRKSRMSSTSFFPPDKSRIYRI